jgi:hypothetical protein
MRVGQGGGAAGGRRKWARKLEKTRAVRSFHGPDPAWREGVDCHVGQNGENVGCSI